jgi:hypothetical protein
MIQMTSRNMYGRGAFASVRSGSDNGFSVASGRSSFFQKDEKPKRLSSLNFIGYSDQTESFSDRQRNIAVSKRTFSKMTIESSDHPFFKRVWLVRHVLNETSPFLTPGA